MYVVICVQLVFFPLWYKQTKIKIKKDTFTWLAQMTVMVQVNFTMYEKKTMLFNNTKL